MLKPADAQDQVEKLLAESLRLLSQTAAKVADLIEAQRLQRAGYESQNVLLRRLDTPRAAEAPGGEAAPKKAR